MTVCLQGMHWILDSCKHQQGCLLRRMWSQKLFQLPPARQRASPFVAVYYPHCIMEPLGYALLVLLFKHIMHLLLELHG